MTNVDCEVEQEKLRQMGRYFGPRQCQRLAPLINIGLILLLVVPTTCKSRLSPSTTITVEKCGRTGDCAVAAMQGRRRTMEDASSVKHLPGISLYGVFDGHAGAYLRAEGLAAIADELSSHLAEEQRPCLLNEEIEIFDWKEELLALHDELLVQHMRNSFKQAFHTLDHQMAKRRLRSGSTAVIAAMAQRPSGQRLIVANTGDSRAVMATKEDEGTLKAVPLSLDHKPGRPDEKLRIEQAGGYVSYSGIPRVNGVLAVSRAFGDYSLKARGVIVEPEIMEFQITQRDQFFILASDGLWDEFTNEEAVAFVHERLAKGKTLEQTSRDLVQKAYDKGSSDNITILLVLLNLTYKKAAE